MFKDHERRGSLRKIVGASISSILIGCPQVTSFDQSWVQGEVVIHANKITTESSMSLGLQHPSQLTVVPHNIPKANVLSVEGTTMQIGTNIPVTGEIGWRPRVLKFRKLAEYSSIPCMTAQSPNDAGYINAATSFKNAEDIAIELNQKDFFGQRTTWTTICAPIKKAEINIILWAGK